MFTTAAGFIPPLFRMILFMRMDVPDNQFPAPLNNGFVKIVQYGLLKYTEELLDNALTISEANHEVKTNL